MSDFGTPNEEKRDRNSLDDKTKESDPPEKTQDSDQEIMEESRLNKWVKKSPQELKKSF